MSTFGTPAYGEPAPFLTEAGATALIDAGTVLVGIDSVNIDDTCPDSAGIRPACTLLLPPGSTSLSTSSASTSSRSTAPASPAVPPKVAGFSTFPVRAFAEIDQA